MNPFQTPQLWDKFVLDGTNLPGLVVDDGDPTNPRNWDKKKGQASSGATLVFSGVDLSTFKIKCQLITDADWEDYNNQKDRLKAPKAKNPPSYSCFYPSLELLPEPINAVVITDSTAPKQNGDQWFYTVSFSQDRRAKPAAGGKSKGATEYTGGSKKDALDKTIDQLKSQIQGLSK